MAKGHGFGSGEPVKLYWDKVGGVLLGTTTANSLGGWGGGSAITFTVPMSPSGTTYPVVAVGQNTGWRASAQFTIATFLHLSWSSGAAIPNAHIEAAGAVANNKLYAISGGGGDCTDGGGSGPTTAVDIYDPSTNTWSSGPAVNVARNQDPVAVTLGSKIYLIGGTTGCGGAAVTTVESLDLGTNVWTALPAASNLPGSLTGNNHCAAAAGTKIYYFQSAGIGVFDTTTQTWSVLPANPLLSPSSYCKAVPYGTNKIQISGPGNGGADANSQRVLTFDATSNTISVGARTTVPGCGARLGGAAQPGGADRRRLLADERSGDRRAGVVQPVAVALAARRPPERDGQRQGLPVRRRVGGDHHPDRADRRL